MIGDHQDRDRDGEDRVLPPPTQPMPVATELSRERLSTPDGDLRVRHWRGAFWEWLGTHWAELPEPTLKSAAYRFTEFATWVKVTPKGMTVEPWAPTRHKVDDVIDSLRAITHLGTAVDMPSWLPARDGTRPGAATYRADHYVSCANGLLHVPTRTLYPHSPAFWNQVSVPFDYVEHPAPPARWLAFLADLWPDDPDAIAALRQWFGYVISGRTDMHKIMLLIGPTRAGKGVIARVLKSLVGRGSYAGPTLASLGTNFGLQPLIGKPLAIVSDARMGDSNANVVVERLLSVSGEDMLTVDVKFKEPWTGTLPTRFLIASNELPRFGDASGAIANRLVILTLRESWLGREDTALTDRLIEELPGILGWALDGLEELRAQGRFTEPRSSTDAIMTMADLVSPVSAFLRDRCLRGPGHEVPVKTLYAAWREWAQDNGHHPGSAHIFGRNLRAVVPGLAIVRARQGDDRERIYQGIALLGRSDAPPAEDPHVGHPNGEDRGPLRTTPSEPVRNDAPVRNGPQSQPLQAPYGAGDPQAADRDVEDRRARDGGDRSDPHVCPCGAPIRAPNGVCTSPDHDRRPRTCPACHKPHPAGTTCANGWAAA